VNRKEAAGILREPGTDKYEYKRALLTVINAYIELQMKGMLWEGDDRTTNIAIGKCRAAIELKEIIFGKESVRGLTGEVDNITG
jgi:hypothetical protein